MNNSTILVIAKAFDKSDTIAIRSRKIRSYANINEYIRADTATMSLTGGIAMPMFGGGMGMGMPMFGGQPSTANQPLSEDDIINTKQFPLFDDLLTVESSEKLMLCLHV